MQIWFFLLQIAIICQTAKKQTKTIIRGGAMVARGTVNPQVAGSNPARGARIITSSFHTQPLTKEFIYIICL